MQEAVANIQIVKTVDFDIQENGLYAIKVVASCRKLQDLRMELDGHYFREVPALKNIQKFDVAAAWNGERVGKLARSDRMVN